MLIYTKTDEKEETELLSHRECAHRLRGALIKTACALLRFRQETGGRPSR